MHTDFARLSTLPVVAAAWLSACGSDDNAIPPIQRPPLVAEFRSEGLEGGIVNQLRRNGDKLFAATDDGLYEKAIGQSSWRRAGLDDFDVLAFVVIGPDHWFASGFAASDTLREHPKLFETVNAGSNWLEVRHDFGGSRPEPIYALIEAGSGVLYATGTAALARSDDLGRTWEVVDGTVDSTGALQALGHNLGHIWFGGQNGIEQMVLRRYDPLSGLTTAFPASLPSPSVIKGITFDAFNPDRVIAAGEGGILQTLDRGQTWTNLLGDVDHRFYFGAVFDPVERNTLYTAGWTKSFDDPQPLILEVSRDGGRSWQQHQFADNTLFGGVWSILAVREGNTTAIYLGLHRGGIYRATFR